MKGIVNKWFDIYFSNKKIGVKCKTNSTTDVVTSDDFSVTYGTAQGSYLGPLLFILFCNDIHLVTEHCNIILFADDTTLYYSHSNPSYLKWALEGDLYLIHDWFKANKLSLNISKTVYMDFSPRPTIPKIKFGDLELLSTKETKFIGINLDNNLSWGHHFNILYNKLLLNKRLLALTKNTLSIMAKVSIYNAHICSHLTYTKVVWGSMLTDNKIEKLYKI